MAGNKKKIIAFNYFGGKSMLTEELYKYFPVHHHFVDLFCGSLVITLNKAISNIDTANDINGDVINFFRVLRNQPDKLLTQLILTPVSREEYECAWDPDENEEVERARRFYVRIRQSFYGLGAQRKNKGWHLTTKNSRAHLSEVVSKWLNGIDKLVAIAERLRYIQFENSDFRKLIPAVDSRSTFFYCDPPYPKETRTSKGSDYRYDFTAQDHADLAEMLHNIKGMAMISGYEGRTMDELYHDWIKIQLGCYRTISGKRNKECIWINYTLEGKQTKLL